MLQWGESQRSNRGGNRNRSAELFQSGRDIQGMKRIGSDSRYIRFGGDVHRVAGGIDDRCAKNSKFIQTRDAAATFHRARDRSAQAYLPELGAGIGLDGVYAVMLSGEENHVVRAAADAEAVHVQGLRRDVAVHVEGIKLSELARGHAGGR